MSKKGVIFSSAIAILAFGLLAYFSPETKNPVAGKSTPQNKISIKTPPKNSEEYLLDQQLLVINNSTPKAQPQISSLIFPFSSNSNTNYSGMTKYAQGRVNFAWVAGNFTRLKTVTFANLTENMPKSTTSSFICPSNLPYAISYTLESPIQAITVNGQKYKNACFGEPGGSANNDLLYGANQNIDSWGRAQNLSAFIPKQLSEGCHTSANNTLIPIRLAASTTQVSTIIISMSSNNTNQSIATGFKQINQVKVDCIQVCNSAINNECANDISYCNETIAATYTRSSSYQIRNIHEDFCACQINNPLSDPPYNLITQAVDISNAVNYSNRLTSVTCSNLPTNKS